MKNAADTMELHRQWDKTQNTIQHNLVGNLFCLGAGGIFTVFLSACFGRLPVLLSFTSMALGTSAWCGAATSFNSYLAARILNGFFSTVAQAVSPPLTLLNKKHLLNPGI